MLLLMCLALMPFFCCHLDAYLCLQRTIWQLCVSPGRAITMVTPSNEHRLKGWAPFSLSLSFISSQATLPKSPTLVSWETERVPHHSISAHQPSLFSVVCHYVCETLSNIRHRGTSSSSRTSLESLDSKIPHSFFWENYD